MSFKYVVFQNDKAIAGFNDFINACNFKDMMRNINRTAGYQDHFKIIDVSKK